MTPLFIIGNPRSGTSLLRLMLTCHKNIIIPPESHFFLWLEQTYCNWNEKDGLDQFLIDLFASTKFETWKLSNLNLKEYLSKQNCKSYSDLIQATYLFYGLKHNKNNIKVWGDKNKLWKEKLSTIPNYFPKGKYIHIIRDGRDVASSFISLHKKNIQSKYAPKLPHTITDISKRWNENIIAIEVFLNSINEENKFVMRFEDLILNPKSELIKITKFLNIPYDSEMLNYLAINSEEEYEPKVFMPWKNKLKELPDPNIIGKYKENLDKGQVKIFEEFNKNLLIKYGY